VANGSGYPPAMPALLDPVAGRPEQRRFRRHWSGDWVVFQIVFGVAAIVGGVYRWPLALFFGAFFAFATWARLQRTIVDRAQPLEPLRVARHVKTSKGTKTVTFEIHAGDRLLADGLPAKTAGELAHELCDFLGRPRIDVPE
jgi:hypothetical protein